jgi:hypothetical protein
MFRTSLSAADQDLIRGATEYAKQNHDSLLECALPEAFKKALWMKKVASWSHAWWKDEPMLCAPWFSSQKCVGGWLCFN